MPHPGVTDWGWDHLPARGPSQWLYLEKTLSCHEVNLLILSIALGPSQVLRLPLSLRPRWDDSRRIYSIQFGEQIPDTDRSFIVQRWKGAPGWLSRLSVRLQLRSWSHSLWVRAPRRALCWQLRAWSLEPASDSVSPSLSAPPLLAFCLSQSLSLKNKIKHLKNIFNISGYYTSKKRALVSLA